MNKKYSVIGRSLQLFVLTDWVFSCSMAFGKAKTGKELYNEYISFVEDKMKRSGSRSEIVREAAFKPLTYRNFLSAIFDMIEKKVIPMERLDTNGLVTFVPIPFDHCLYEDYEEAYTICLLHTKEKS